MTAGGGGRIEDERLVTGRGRFTGDVAAAGELHAVFVRSPHASARLREIDLAGALAVDGVVAGLTAAELTADGIGPFSAPVKVAGPDGTEHRETPRPLLVGDRIRFVGEPVAMILAETRAAAIEAAEAVLVDAEPLDAVATPAQARLAGAPALWDDRPGNLAFHWRGGDWEGAGAALAASHHVARLETRVSRVSAAPMEPRNALAVPEGTRTTLYAGHQSAPAMRAALARVLGIEPACIRVVSGDVGGSFGMKAGPLREEILVFWAARRLGRPVRWRADRSEAFLTDEAGRDMAIGAELGLDADGHFTALRVSLTVNVGAYASARSTSSITNIGGIAGVYRTPHVAGESRGAFTNTAPTAPYRGAGRPEATLAIERVIDVAARELGLDRFELRRRNLVPPSAMPYRTPFLFHYDSGDYARNMQVAGEQADYAGFARRRAAAEARGRLRGIGVANAVESAGGPFGNPGTDHGRVEVAADGTISLFCGAMSAGQGLETAMTGLAAEALGLPVERFRYVEGDTAQLESGKGMGGSAAMSTGGSALMLGVERMLAQASELAAEELEAAVGDIVYEAGEFRIAGTDRAVDLATLAQRRAARGDDVLSGSGAFRPEDCTYPSGCHICEVEIDPETGRCEVVGYSCVEDVGRLLNRQLAEGQVQGGVAQALGQVLCEAVSHDADGQMLSASFSDYAMPRAEDLPNYATAFEEMPTPRNPLGVKGVGEAGTVGALSAGLNAICDALASAGGERFEMPATPHRVWAALAAARDARAGVKGN